MPDFNEYVNIKCSKCLKDVRIKENSYIQNVKKHDGYYICASCIHRGLKKSPETRSKIAKSLSGRNLSISHRKKISESVKQSRKYNTLKSRKNIGIFYGNFDPPHNGHLIACLSALAFSPINEVWWMPSYNSPGCSPAIRKKMIYKIIDSHGKFKYIDFCVKNKLNIPQYEVIEKFLKLNTYNYNFYWIVGTNEIQDFNSWPNHLWIANNINFCVIHKNDFNFHKSKSQLNNARHIFINKTKFVTTGISSSLIRDKNFATEQIQSVPEEIKDIIIEDKLYG